MSACLRALIPSVRFLLLLLILLLFPSFGSPANAASLPTGFTETSVGGLSGPTAMEIAPDGRIFVSQQGGQLRVIKNGALLSTPFVTLPVDSAGERGLLGIAFDPAFASNHFIYLYYTSTTPTTHNRVSRFTANGDVAVAGSEHVIIDLNDLSSATNHNGGGLHFGPDGKLYITAGENANPANSQTLNNLLGKMLRINSDGTIPTDNPFFNTAAGANRAIWALGLRNPFTFGFQPGTGRLFINDVGQNTWEEIDDGIAGSNYGWNLCEGFCSPANPSFRDPLFEYGHGSTLTTGCAIVGGAFYNPQTAQFPADYVGKYFFADLCGGWIRRFNPATGTADAFASGISSPVDLKVGSDGSLYYLSQGSGAVFRVQFSAAVANAFQFNHATYTVSEAGPTATITVTRSGDTSTPATVDFSTSDGTATQQRDYTTSAATLAFAPGDTSKTFDILITDDAYVEGSETVNLMLSNPTGGPMLGTQTTATLTITDNDATAPTSNPADVPQFFVRQQYSDFLDRVPDQGGFDYWTGQITQCGSDPICTRQRRVGVSGAFFVENEFQLTGGYIYRMYKAAFGTLSGAPNRTNITYLQFISDHGRVIGGTQLEQSKTDFASAFVLRAAFTAAYPASMTPAQYVDALNANTGNALSPTDRDALVNGLISGSETRGTALRKVAENQHFVDLEYNASFVLSEYFGYLRRDPDQAGYDFWMNQINRFPLRDPAIARALVCSFVTSFEYQLRFSSVMTHDNTECQ